MWLLLAIGAVNKDTKSKKDILQTTMVIIIEDFFTFYQFLFSPQVKQSVIIISKHGIYEMFHKLPSCHELPSSFTNPIRKISNFI